MRHTLSPDNVTQLSPVAQVRIGWISSVIWSPDGQTIAISGGTRVYVYYRSFGATPTFTLEGHDAPVKDIAFGRDNDLLAAVGADGQVLIWHVDGAPRRIHRLSVLDALTCVAFSTDSRRLVAGTASGGVWLWSLATGAETELPYPHSGEVAAVRWRAGHVFTAARDGELLGRDMSDTRAAPVVAAAQSDWIRDFDISNDNRVLYTVSRDGTLRGWTRDGDMIFRVMAHDGGADCVAVHYKGNLLATGGRDNVIRLWDTRPLLTGRAAVPIAILDAHSKPVLTLAFNPQGTMLLSGGGDNTARLWSVEERNNGGN